MQMKTVAIIQARMSSTRLPGKVLLPIGDTNAIQMIVDRCKANPLIDEVVVATTENEKDKAIQIYCIENKIAFYVGTEENVLDRVYCAAKLYKADIIVDITSDCPFIDLSNLWEYIGPLFSKSMDYVSNVITRTFPDGLDLQVYSFDALNWITKNTYERKYWQHTGWNFTRFTGIFKTLNIQAPKELNYPEIRITLDTAEDYAVLNLIYALLGSEATTLQIVNFLLNNPNILRINSNVKAKIPGDL